MIELTIRLLDLTTTSADPIVSSTVLSDEFDTIQCNNLSFSHSLCNLSHPAPFPSTNKRSNKVR